MMVDIISMMPVYAAEDEDPSYCDGCGKEISTYLETVGEGFCYECQMLNEERTEL